MPFLFKKNLFKAPLNLRVEIIDIGKHIELLLNIEKACFEEHMQDSRQEIIDYFSDKKATGMILFENNTAIGAMKGTQISETNSPGIFSQYPFLKEKQKLTFYSDSIAILADYRTTLVLDFFIHEIAVFVKRYGFEFFTGHARVRRGYSRLLQRRYGAQKLDSYKDWQGFEEPFDYILFDLKTFPTLNGFSYFLMLSARKVYALLRTLKNEMVKNKV